MKYKPWILIAGFFFANCSQQSGVNVSLDIASNQSQNPLIAIDQDWQAGASQGLFFVFQELKDSPSNINDSSSATAIRVPDSASGGLPPLQKNFNLPTGSLISSKYYRLTVEARNASNQVTHSGVADCPIKLDLQALNDVSVCFGLPNTTPLCGTSKPFQCCPGVGQPTSAQCQYIAQ